jgi:uncharacterized SAM-binding protein YcdF (DUF218 family)
MLTRKKLTITLLVCFGIIGLASAALFNDSTEKVEEESTAENKPLQTMAIPLIDITARAQTETATFSLG